MPSAVQIVDLEEDHLADLRLQPMQASLASCLDDNQYRESLASFEGYAAIRDGKVLGAAGIVPQDLGRALAWALLSETGSGNFVAIHRAVKLWLFMCEHRRIETWVKVGDRNGVRWANMLGFKEEGVMRAFLPDGGDAYLFARVRSDSEDSV